MKINSTPPWGKLAKLAVFTSLVISLSLFAQDVNPSKETALEGVQKSQIEKVRRQADLLQSQKMIAEAEGLISRGDHASALSLYDEAQKLVTDAPASSRENSQIRSGRSTCLYELARQAYDNKDFAQAMSHAEMAYQLNPENAGAKDLHERASRSYEKSESRNSREDRTVAEVPPEISNKDFVKKQQDVYKLYQAAEAYFQSEQFDEAEESYKRILQIDPFSATAYHRLREVQLAKYKKLSAAKLQTETESMLDVQKGWQLPLRRDRSGPGVGETVSELDLGGKAAITKKLNDIIIKKIEFDNTSIQNAIKYLNGEARAADLSGVGVNIIFDPTGAPAVPPATQDPTASAADGGGFPTVTLDMRSLSLLQAIQYVTQQTNLKYRVESNAVVVSAVERVDIKPTTRIFSVAPGIFVSTIESTGGGGAGGAGFTPLGTSTTTVKADVKRAFEQFGIEFPPGTSVFYQEALGILLATHTSEILDRMETIVLKLNKVPPQIQIETKFIDIKMDDLQELGFRWAMRPTRLDSFMYESGLGTTLATQPITPGSVGTTAGGSTFVVGADTFTGGNRSASDITGSALDALLTGGTSTLVGAGVNTVMTISGALTNPQFQVMIDALDRKGYTNLLSAPRVTTTSGETAKILITREFIYPSQWSDPQVQVSSGGTSGTGVGITAPSPSTFTTREVGVILEVNPKIGTDAYTINLTLSPEVVDFEGYITYNTSVITGSSQFTFSIPQPLFSKRTLTTNIMIWDGQTVGLGGLIREDVRKVNDKIPILGDLPIIGRLFQSKVDSTTKRNLIIFLTARIVTPGGQPLHKYEETLIPPSANP